MDAVTARPAARRPARRRSRASLHVLGAALMILVGAFLPWVSTAAGTVPGVRGAGIWTLYAACLGIAGAIVKAPRVAAAHAALMGSVAVVLTLWQLLHLVGLVGFGGWLPGPGLVMTFGGGVLAASAAVRLWRQRP